MMQNKSRAPNRILDLRDLERPSYRRVLRKLEGLLARENVSYLHPGKRWEYPWALERATLAPGSRVLDAGCGASIFPIFLAAQRYRVSALDLDPPFGLDRLHGVEVDYVRGELTTLPFADDSFDCAFCISVIEHLSPEGIPVALSELRRVIRRGARLLLTTDYYQDADAELWYEGPGEPFRVNWSFFDEMQLRRLVLHAPGFRVDGAVDLTVDWDLMRPQMRAFMGYPYTAVGIALAKV